MEEKESNLVYLFRTTNPYCYNQFYSETIREDEYELLFRGKDGKIYSYNDLYKSVRRMPDDWREVNDVFIKDEFAYRLKCRMWLRGVMQDHLAEALGVSQGTVSNWVRGRIIPNYCQIIQIAQVLRCSIDDFRYHF